MAVFGIRDEAFGKSKAVKSHTKSYAQRTPGTGNWNSGLEKGPVLEVLDQERVGVFVKILCFNTSTDEESVGYYVIAVVIIVIVALMTVYHVQIVHWLTPVATWLRDK